MNIKHIISLLVLAGLMTGPAYAKKDKDKQLPPGLQKKVERGQSLPPGWQKKLAKGEILEKEIYQHGQVIVPVDKRGLITIRLEGKLVRLYEATREVVEVL
ncbi:MAG: hypothetical protein PVG45_01200 [Gammaproteobacteria bacterium]|jgi:hypothetical protein